MSILLQKKKILYTDEEWEDVEGAEWVISVWVRSDFQWGGKGGNLKESVCFWKAIGLKAKQVKEQHKNTLRKHIETVTREQTKL